MKTRRVWNNDDKRFLKRLSRAVERATEICEGPIMDYYPNGKAGGKLALWGRRLRAIGNSIERDIERIN